MKILTVLIAYLMVCSVSFAQNLANISGRITDEKLANMANALVEIKSTADTNFKKSTQTSADGIFVFENIIDGTYSLQVRNVGYKTAWLRFLVANGDVNLQTIKLETNTNLLKEVVVEVKKPFIEHKIDKTVLNIENSITTAGNTALEVLEKAPGVTVDKQNNQIRLNNKSGVNIMINGKTNMLSDTDIATLLSNMSSDQIATIELITNPSSKYDAAGNAGIINIVLKKNKNFGTNGSMDFNSWLPLTKNIPPGMYRVGSSLTLNHRTNQWNIYGLTAFNRKSNTNRLDLDRTTLSDGLESAFKQYFNRIDKGHAFLGKLGADFYATDRTVIGIMVDASIINPTTENISQTYIRETENGVINNNTVLQDAYSNLPFSNITSNFNIKHDFKNKDANLTFDIDYSRFNSEKNDDFDAKYFNDANELDRNTVIKNNNVSTINIYAAKTDFTYPISKSMKLETGLKSSYVKTDNIFLATEYVNGSWQTDYGRSNRFIYKENINAAYVNLGKEWLKWQVQGGLRFEHTYSNGNSVTDTKAVERNYVSLFPTIFVNQKLDINNNIRYSYSRRVDRPNYQQLNPFVFYLDPYTVDQGNPYLKPQFTHNFEISYGNKQFSVSLSYADTKDLMTQITEQNEVTRIISVVRQNLGSVKNYSLGLSVPVKATKWWQMQYHASAFYNKFEGNLVSGAYSAEKVACNFYFSQALTLPNNFSVELNGWVNSPKINGVEETLIWQYAINAGLQKSLLNKKFKLKIAVDDVFKTNYWKGKLHYQNVNLMVANKYLTRKLNISINYNFGNQSLKSARERKTATDDIKGRAGGN